ncbi:hypothetical protein KC360_g141 [Hortaea werneckii]|nr:hypothetical protein KC344_g141 [Hortaea werneckii]KAI7180457.1 hypothetical protein KC360_g141 [Hortaea werneckii]
MNDVTFFGAASKIQLLSSGAIVAHRISQSTGPLFLFAMKRRASLVHRAIDLTPVIEMRYCADLLARSRWGKPSGRAKIDSKLSFGRDSRFHIKRCSELRVSEPDDVMSHEVKRLLSRLPGHRTRTISSLLTVLFSKWRRLLTLSA